MNLRTLKKTKDKACMHQKQIRDNFIEVPPSLINDLIIE